MKALHVTFQMEVWELLKDYWGHLWDTLNYGSIVSVRWGWRVGVLTRSQRPLLYGNNSCWSAGAEESAVIRRDQYYWWEIWEHILGVSTQKRGPPPLHLMLAAELGSIRVTQVVLVLKASIGHREQLRIGIVWYGCSPWRWVGRGQLVKVQSRLQYKAQYWEGYREKLKLDTTWQDESPCREPRSGYWWKYSLIAAGDCSILEILVVLASKAALWNTIGLRLQDKLCCVVLWMAKPEVRLPFEAKGTWMNLRQRILNYLHCWSLVLLCFMNVPWFFLLEVS